MHLFLSCCLIFSLLAKLVSAQNCADSAITEDDVFKFIFQNYSRETRPKIKVDDPIVVTVGFGLFGIKEFDESQNKLYLEGYFTVVWQQDLLKWDDEFPYRCIEQLTVGGDNLWLPDLGFLNGHSEIFSFENKKAVINSTGTITAYPVGEVAVTCNLDLALFPFDHQLCEADVQSWIHTSNLMKLQPSPTPFTKVDSLWSENGQWEIVANRTFAISENYMGDALFDHLHFHLLLRRKTLYYFVNVIVPSLTIACAQIATFMLPVMAVIKIHISFTCLLAYSVFQTMIIDDKPTNSDGIPLLSIYIDLQMAYIGIIGLLGDGVVSAVIRKALVTKNPPPIWLIRFAMTLGSFMQLSHHFPSARSLDKKRASIDDTKGKHLRRKMWMFLAEFIQRFNMLLYTTAIILTPCAMFSYAGTLQAVNNDLIYQLSE